MTALVLTPFSGLIPKSDPSMLPAPAAQVAANCRFSSGQLEAYNTPSTVAVAGMPNTGTIYRFGQSTLSDTQYWFTFSNSVNVVKGAVAGDTEERTMWTGDGVPKITTAAMATASYPYPSTYWRLGLPMPTTAPVCDLPTGAYDETSLVETRYYIYTFVSVLGEESEPSAVSDPVDVRPEQSVSISMGPVPTGPYNVTLRRIYRTSTGTTGTDYLLVDEIPAATTIYVDSVLSENLAEPCPSIDYQQLPDLARGMTAMPNGLNAAHTDYDVYFCIPYRPYAYPEKYIQTVDYPIVGMGCFGSSLAVLTTGFPFIMTGTDPESISVEKLSVPYACLSKKSIVSALGGVIYAAADGLVLIDASGPRVLTDQLYTRREWNALNPSSMLCAVWDERILIFYNTGSVQAGLILDQQNGLTSVSLYATAAYTDPVTNSLFLVIDGALVKWDGGPVGTFVWKSKKNVLNMPHNFSFAQVIANSYPVSMGVYASPIEDNNGVPCAIAAAAILTAKGISGVTAVDASTLLYVHSATSSRPFRLPSGFRARTWELGLSGSGRVISAALADSAQELQSV